jgi:hypothetical protein
MCEPTAKGGGVGSGGWRGGFDASSFFFFVFLVYYLTQLQF